MAKKLIYRGSEPTKFKKFHLKKDDEVVVISGSREDKGKKGKILSIDKKRDRVYVSGINKKKKFVRPTQENPQGGEIEIERSIHISNIMLYDSKLKKGVRVGYEVIKGKKERVSRVKGNKKQ
ncbi:MAG: 50S ribosomal protein L24 [Spirochaetia bacterium]|nr:50S ribosomal protein L24 [Spirochaetia bacterium]